MGLSMTESAPRNMTICTGLNVAESNPPRNMTESTPPRNNMTVCTECDKPIVDEFLMRVGTSLLHESCLRCFSCGLPLTESCFSKFGQFYCKQDFYSLFGPR